jgi:hypothetical protein
VVSQEERSRLPHAPHIQGFQHLHGRRLVGLLRLLGLLCWLLQLLLLGLLLLGLLLLRRRLLLHPAGNAAVNGRWRWLRR